MIFASLVQNVMKTLRMSGNVLFYLLKKIMTIIHFFLLYQLFPKRRHFQQFFFYGFFFFNPVLMGVKNEGYNNSKDFLKLN